MVVVIIGVITGLSLALVGLYAFLCWFNQGREDEF